MLPFLNTTEFKELNIGFALDEGLVSADGSLYASYVDKRPWREFNYLHNYLLKQME